MDNQKIPLATKGTMARDPSHFNGAKARGGTNGSSAMHLLLKDLGQEAELNDKQ